MNRIIFTFFVLFFAISVSAQQVAREYVLLEIGTGTWCQYCPGAAMGAEDLIANGKSVAVIEYHGGDDYETTASGARINYYNIEFFPTSFFDGQNPVVGGSNTESLYSDFLPLYNSAIAVTSSFTINVDISTTDDQNFTGQVVIDKVDDYSGTNLKAHIVVTESGIEESWQGQTHLEWVFRTMYPNQNGTSLDFSINTQQTIDLSFALDDSWVTENCEIVVFIQDNDNKNILQTTKASLNLPLGEDVAKLEKIISPTAVNECDTILDNAVIKIMNKGSNNLTSLTIDYTINEETPSTYTWTGDLPFGERTEINLPSVDFTPLETNLLAVEISEPNGSLLPELTDSLLNVEFGVAPKITSVLHFKLFTGTCFGMGYELKSSDGTLIDNGQVMGANKYINEYFELNVDECYIFTVINTYNNGLSLTGYYKLWDSDNFIIGQDSAVNIPKRTDYVLKVNRQGVVVELDEILQEKSNISIYPNPAKDKINFSVNAVNEELCNIKIYDLTGKLMYETIKVVGKESVSINNLNLPSGFYTLAIQSNNKIITENFTILK